MEFIKKNVIWILVILIVLFGVACAILLLWPQSSTQPNIGTEFTPADQIVADENLDNAEQKALLYALDFIYSYGNYSSTEHRLMSLEGNVTPEFQTKVSALISELEKPNANISSTMQPYAEEYSVDFYDDGGVRKARVIIKALLTTNSQPQKEVEVEQVLINQNNYWILEDFQIR